MSQATGFSVDAIRNDFPFFARSSGTEPPLAYLDNAATAQKPQCVLDAVLDLYRDATSNVHRGVHRLSAEATRRYENARDIVQRYIHAHDRCEIVFTRGTTESVNLVAQSYVRPLLGAGDEILITQMEHHSNFVPWQMVAEQTGAVVRVAPVTPQGELDLDAWRALLTERTKFVSVVHTSNAIGTINPVAEIVRLAHERGVAVLVDGAQAMPHQRVDVQALGADFFAFSGHKVFGPTGIGVLYGKQELLDDMPPYQGGGDMIKLVSLTNTVWNDLPYKFEAGTPNIAGAVGLGAALEWMKTIDLDGAALHERALHDDATARLRQWDDVRLIGTAAHKAAVVAFVMDGVHPHDIGTILDQARVAIRTGHHCAQPLLESFGVHATARASFALYNTHEEVAALAAGMAQVRELFGA